MVTPANFKPDEDVVGALVSNVTVLVGAPKRNCFAGPVEAYTVSGTNRIPHLAVFVSASGGLSSRQLKGNSAGNTNERHPSVSIRIRSGGKGVASAFQVGQTLARDVFNALHHAPPTIDYIEAESLNSQPTYLGRDDDGHHEWLVVVQLIVDVVSP